jgi:MFS family permease
MFSAGLIGRIPSAVLGFSTLLLVQSTTGSFALGGLVSGTIVAANATVGPYIGHLADRHGQRRLLRVLAPVNFLAIIAVLISAMSGVEPGLLVAVAAVAGGSQASIGSFTRARWSHIFGESPPLRTAFALESMLDDCVWIVGPAIAAFLSVVVDPSIGLIVAAATGLLGGLLLAAQRATDTPPQHAESRRRHFNPFHSLTVMVVLLSGLTVGLSFGVNDLSAIAITKEDGVPQFAGFILGVFSVGSLIGGVVFGLMRDRWSHYRLFAVVCAYLAVTWLPLAFAPNTLWFMILGPIAGTAASPFIIATNRLIRSLAGNDVVTEALAWMSSAIVAGMAGGSFFGGVIVDALGARAGFATVTALMLVPLALAGVGALARKSRRVSALSPSPQ